MRTASCACSAAGHAARTGGGQALPRLGCGTPAQPCWSCYSTVSRRYLCCAPHTSRNHENLTVRRCCHLRCPTGRATDTAWNHDLNWKVRRRQSNMLASNRSAMSSTAAVAFASEISTCAYSLTGVGLGALLLWWLCPGVCRCCLQNRCKLEKEEMAARAEFNEKLKEERVREQRERTRKLAQTRLGVSGALIPAAAPLSTGRSGKHVVRHNQWLPLELLLSLAHPPNFHRHC